MDDIEIKKDIYNFIKRTEVTGMLKKVVTLDAILKNSTIKLNNDLSDNISITIFYKYFTYNDVPWEITQKLSRSISSDIYKYSLCINIDNQPADIENLKKLIKDWDYQNYKI